MIRRNRMPIPAGRLAPMGRWTLAVLLALTPLAWAATRGPTRLVTRPPTPPLQAIRSRQAGRKENGTMVSKPLEDQWPFLDRDELKSNMMIPLVRE